jgi:hypothetical protein
MTYPRRITADNWTWHSTTNNTEDLQQVIRRASSLLEEQGWIAPPFAPNFEPNEEEEKPNY